MTGIDGCRAGWVAARWRGGKLSFSVHPFLLDALEGPVALDMPIGLPDRPGRECDRLARQLLGPRRSSVFSPPTRAVLAQNAFRGVSLQCYNLFPRLREVDELMTPPLQELVRETHPELAFARLNGAPLVFPKRKAEGRAERLELLRAELGPGWEPPRLTGAAPDDLLDAAVLALVARDFRHRVPEHEPQRDARGLRMEIWY